MARWRLTAGHYLNVPGTEWEYRETDRQTGKQARKVFNVPLLLNTEDQADHNYPGEIIVCHVGKGQGKDIEFVGEPTPDMEPLDDEARAISASLAHKWKHPIDSLPGSFADNLIARFQEQMQVAAPAPAPNTSIDPGAFVKLQEQVQALMQQNAELIEKLANPPASADGSRRV